GDPVPNQQFLQGRSLLPPVLAGDPADVLFVAWADGMQQDQMLLATNISSPPFQPMNPNPGWKTMLRPALAKVDHWGHVFLAWTDPEGAVYLGSSAKDWTTSLLIAPPGSAQFGPALTYGNDLLFIAWNNKGVTWIAALDRSLHVVSTYATDEPMLLSQPSLSWDDRFGSLYILSGWDGQSVPEMVIAWSEDNGKTFKVIEDPPAKTCFGPPSLVVIDSTYYIAWADDNTGNLHIATAKILNEYQITEYDAPCHEGGPALAGSSAGLAVGWTYGASPQDPHRHQIAIGTPPLS
ncbi:MAG TPA: hypothetical protein VF914_03075, partial [Chloroflexia bacterium]